MATLTAIKVKSVWRASLGRSRGRAAVTEVADGAFPGSWEWPRCRWFYTSIVVTAAGKPRVGAVG